MKQQLGKVVLLGVSLLALCNANGEKAYGYRLSRHPVDMTFYAMDEWGKPLAGEPVRLRPFLEDKLFAKWGTVHGVTDSNGYFRVRGTPAGAGEWGLFCYFRPDDYGYYKSFIEVGAGDQPIDMVVTGVVRKIVNPIKLYTGDVNLYERKELSAEFGIDIVKCDLMPPDGSGSVTDAVFRISSELWEDSAEGHRNPRKVHATLEMVDKTGGFVTVPRIRNCDYELVREAPAEGKYNPVLSGDIDMTSERYGNVELAGCEYKKTHAIYKVVRGRECASSEKHSFYGLVYVAEVSTAFMGPRDDYGWDFHLSVASNGHPDDRNLERFSEGLVGSAWYEANRDRIMEVPTPEAVK